MSCNAIRSQKMRSGKSRGFTLIELMVVIVILGMLVALVGPNVWHALTSGTKEAANQQMANLGGAIDMYVLENKSLPNSLDELTQPSKRSGQPYIEKIPNDPWDQPYTYRKSEGGRREYTITSSGEDKMAGTEDDMYFPQRKESSR
jgi:general secretion pathway protein G